MLTRYEGSNKIASITTPASVDTGWIGVEWTSNFKNYDDLPYNGAQVRRIGNIVYLRGVAAPTQELPSSTGQVMLTVPDGFRPDVAVYGIMQGSDSRRWLIAIRTDGTTHCSRYGVDSFENISTRAWLPFNTSYVVGGDQ